MTIEFREVPDYAQVDVILKEDTGISTVIGYITPNGDMYNVFVPDSECPGLDGDVLYELHEKCCEHEF